MDKKLIVFLGGGLAVGGAVFAWYFLFGSDMVQREAARKPIAQWEAEWQKARRCLLGDSPKEADPGDTLAIHALDELEIHCSLADLGRPEGQGSGIPEIEDAWGKIETAWHALAAAVPDPDKMGPQIRALDAADAQLRDGAKMPALDAPKPTRAIAELALGKALANDGIDDSIVPPTIGHAFYGGSGTGRLALRAPGVATSTADQAGVVRGWPDASWGAGYSESGGDTSVAFGPIAADGSLGAGAEVVMRGQVVGVMAAIGGGAQREIFVRVLPAHPSDDYDTQLAIVKTTDGGAHWSKPQPIAGAWDIALSDSGDDQPAILGHKDADTPAFLFFDKATGAPVPVATLGTPDPSRTCFAGALWYSSSDDEGAIARAAPGAPAPPITPFEDRVEVLACTADAVAVRVNQKIHRCTTAGCDGGLDVPNHIGFADVFDGSGVVFAAQAGRVIGVWRSGQAPVYDRAPAGATLTGVAVWDKTPMLAFRTHAGIQLAPMK